MTGPLADGRPGLRNWLLAGCSVAALLAAGPVQAADFTVTTTNDAGAGSFRQAIITPTPPPRPTPSRSPTGSAPSR